MNDCLYNKIEFDNDDKSILSFAKGYSNSMWINDVRVTTNCATFYDPKLVDNFEHSLTSMRDKYIGNELAVYAINDLIKDLRHSRNNARRNIEIFPAKFGSNLYFKMSNPSS